MSGAPDTRVIENRKSINIRPGGRGSETVLNSTVTTQATSASCRSAEHA